MGKDFVANSSSIISASFKKAAASKGRRLRKIFTSSIVNNIQSLSSINDMKDSSEFAHNAAMEEQKKRDDRDGFMRSA